MKYGQKKIQLENNSENDYLTNDKIAKLMLTKKPPINKDFFSAFCVENGQVDDI